MATTRPGGVSLDECAALADACGPAVGLRDAVSGLTDQELIGKLKHRHKMTEGLPGTKDLSENREMADSEHFSLDACESPSRAEDHAAHAAETFCSEWQFEIMNSLPRNKALELVEHLRLVVTEREQADAEARLLRRANSELEQRLGSAERRKEKEKGRMCSLCLLGLTLFAVALVSMGALSPPAVGGSARCPPAPPPLDDLGEPEADPTDSSAEAVRRENEELRDVLERLRLDVSEAERNNQSVVCWNL